MARQEELPSIDAATLDKVTGGVTRSSTSSSSNAQITSALQSITSSLSSLGNQNNQSSLSQLLPLLVLTGGLGKGGACPCGCGMANCGR